MADHKNVPQSWSRRKKAPHLRFRANPRTKPLRIDAIFVYKHDLRPGNRLLLSSSLNLQALEEEDHPKHRMASMADFHCGFMSLLSRLCDFPSPSQKSLSLIPVIYG
jgi:hypothetical protein